MGLFFFFKFFEIPFSLVSVAVYRLKVLTLTDFWIPLLVHWYLIWYFKGMMSILIQVEGGDHLSHRLLAFRVTWTSTGGSGFTAKNKKKKKNRIIMGS